MTGRTALHWTGSANYAFMQGGPPMRNYLFEREQALSPALEGPPPEKAEKQRRQAKRRTVLSAVCFLLLICGLTAAAVWFRQAEGSMLDHLEDAAGEYGGSDPFFGVYPGLQDRDKGETPVTRIPKAPAGVGPLLSVAEHSGDALTAEEIYKKVLPSVVGITAYGAEMGSSGTGIVLSADGYIVTNYHVIEGMSRAVITPLNSGKASVAKLVGYDADMDVAVLKVEKNDLVPAEFGSSRELLPGQTVYAIGNPMGYLYGSMTDGIVSYVNRSVSVDGHSMTLIQTSAALNSGNSGGALVNRWGQVVGITVAKIDPPSEVTIEGLGLAIPISEARRCVNTLLRTGKMENPAIGISCRDWPSGDGVLVLVVNEGGPAEEAGLQVDDVILTAGGRELDGVDTLKDIIFDLGVGAELDCTVLRSNQELTFTLELREAAE